MIEPTLFAGSREDLPHAIEDSKDESAASSKGGYFDIFIGLFLYKADKLSISG